MNFDHINDPLVAEKAAIKWEESAERSITEWTALGEPLQGNLEARESRKNAAALRALARKLRGE